VGFAHKDACGAEVRGCDIVLEERARIADQARQTAILTQERVVAFGVCTVVAGQSQQYQCDPSDNHRDAWLHSCLALLVVPAMSPFSRKQNSFTAEI
jgi:hypothetical protein